MKKREKPIHVAAAVRMEEKKPHLGIALELLLLLTGLVGYLFCNTTALDMQIHPLVILLISVLSLGAMIALVWFKRVFFGVLGGLAGVSLLAWPISFPMFRSLWRSLVVCYNYTVYLLASQPNYSDYKDHLTMDIETVIATPMILQRHFNTALVLVALIAAVFFALAFFRRIPPILAFLVPMAGLIPFFLYGIVPHYVAFSVFLSAVIGCYGQSAIRQMNRIKLPKAQKGKGQKKKPAKEILTSAQRLNFAARSGSFGIVVMAMMLLITMLTATFIYTRPIVEMETVRKGIDMLAEDAMNLIFAETYEKNLNVGGYMEEGETLALEVPRWRRLKVATVYATTDTPVYLRYRTAVELAEEGWTMPDEEHTTKLNEWVDPSFCEYTQFYKYIALTSGEDPLAQDLDAVDSEERGYVKDEITIKPKYRVSNVLGIPGGAVEASPVSKYNELERVGDTVLMHHDSPRNRTYTFQVVTPVFTNNAFLGTFQKTQDAYASYRARYSSKDSFLNNELKYSGFVKSHYIALYSGLDQLVRPLAKELTDKYPNQLEKVQAIERYFRENYSYSTARQRLVLEDGSLASAYDQVNYFLFQNKEKTGYCTLFSTSMVSMLRSLNIPARVVSGYYATPQMIDVDEYGTELSDNNFHSWVEVYFDGIGWITFEPTPGFGPEPNYYLLDLVDQGLQSEFADQEVTIEEEKIEGIIIYTDVLPEPTMPEEEEKIPLAALPIFRQTPPWVKILVVVLFALMLVALLVYGVFWGHHSALRRIKTLPPKKGVQAGYYVILRLMQMRGFKFFEGELLESFAQRVDNLALAPLPMKPILPILQKALFSDLELSEEERKPVVDFVLALDKKMFRSVNPFKALWCSITLRAKPRHQKMIWKFEK